MRLLLKIAAAPVIVALAMFVWICSSLLYCSAFIFGIVSTVIALLGLAVLVTYSPKNGLILWGIAFLVSPVGLPMAAAWVLGKVQDLRYWIQDGICG
ncbi:CD1845 family protein [Cuneatibacter sp. NSJ-177]|uniref:CD1845 family protein n=1 Tax=Cuneatibacter sp. NSJ-177 TaxID=2931401 RepID=UPI001FD225D1|nr:CD1845 family protein [Cuneatibacter sp. NSJ-177]MCJ7837135.1 CD1845 family protein [Cuneatibacter sp. NSJ-177]